MITHFPEKLETAGKGSCRKKTLRQNRDKNTAWQPLFWHLNLCENSHLRDHG